MQYVLESFAGGALNACIRMGAADLDALSQSYRALINPAPHRCYAAAMATVLSWKDEGELWYAEGEVVYWAPNEKGPAAPRPFTHAFCVRFCNGEATIVDPGDNPDMPRPIAYLVACLWPGATAFEYLSEQHRLPLYPLWPDTKAAMQRARVQAWNIATGAAAPLLR
jgi:hypothetical protein